MRVVDTDAPSYQGRTTLPVLCTAETYQKRWKYLYACQDCWAGFIPLCFSVDGMLGTEAGYFMH